MSLHDFTRTGRDRARWRFRLHRARRGLGLPGPPERGPGGAWAARRGRRRLAAIDRALATETPRLASMFAMFTELAAEEPVGAERLPSRAWPRLRLTHVAFLATLAAIVALCVTLSTQVHSVMRPCLASAATSSGASPAASPIASPALSPPGSPAALSALSPAASPSAPAAPGPAGAAPGLAVFVPVRGLSCLAYATTNK